MIETERRFLLRTMPLIMEQRYVLIDQGYMGFEPVTRVRIIENDEEGTCHAWLCVKGPKINGSGTEYEYEIPFLDGQQIFAECKYRVVKTRYYIPWKGRTWEVDRFFGDLSGLLIAEIELDDINEPLELPEWIDGPEITDNFHYANSTLALVGLPTA